MGGVRRVEPQSRIMKVICFRCVMAALLCRSVRTPRHASRPVIGALGDSSHPLPSHLPEEPESVRSRLQVQRSTLRPGESHAVAGQMEGARTENYAAALGIPHLDLVTSTLSEILQLEAHPVSEHVDDLDAYAEQSPEDCSQRRSRCLSTLVHKFGNVFGETALRSP